MTNYQIPTADEMRRIQRRAEQMRADALSAGVKTAFHALTHAPVALGNMVRRAAHI